MLQKIVRIFGGDPNKRQVEKYSEKVDYINSLESKYEALSDEALRAHTPEFRRRLAAGETLDDILPEAFAVVRETSKRRLGQRHYDVQLIGGIVLHQGKIAEMRTGEGKTLAATLPIYLNALALNPAWVELAAKRWGEDPSRWAFEPLDEIPVSQGVHLVTVNDYLARRDARWMGEIYDALGLTTGVLQMASRTEEGRKAFVVDMERSSPHEDQDLLRIVPRRAAYATDITYGTNSEFGFDYLRDNMTMRLEDRVQRGHAYAIIDEVDNVLIDEARTPLIISGPAQDDTEWYLRMAQVVKSLDPEDYEISERDRNVTLSEIGETHVEELLGMALRDPERPEDVTPEQARMMGYLEQALRAQFLFRRNKDYLVQTGKVVIVDEFTGRLMPGRRWSDGLHQAVEAKEGVRVQRENVTYATITIQNYFRMYAKLAGMSGTALTEAEEFDEIYKLGVVAIPTNLEYVASRADTDLVVVDDRDEHGYKYQYYADQNDLEKAPLFWRRKDYPDVVFRAEEIKLRAIAQEIVRYHALGRPVLVGTTSVDLSERVSNRLRAEPVRRLAQAILLRDAWMKVNSREQDGRQIPELEFLNQPLDQLPINEMRKMAREQDISFNPESPENLSHLLSILELSEAEGGRLASILQAGIPHQVLNARKHTEESQIIAGAGAYGAVTIATNMAGRGVDIKLGGEMAEEVIAVVNRVLRRGGYQDPYDMNMEERYQALLALNLDEYGIYDAEVKFFLKQIDDMRRVKELGGLHVIGSERHEARRIDNQLRGRAARQGDPGSSRFYLSMQDELMRLFGGEQVENLMKRLKWDDALPLEYNLVGRMVEQAQTRVEGQNFDVRKHLLEYDDVLNTQRAAIYGQRNRIFTKDDLSEDVTEMLRVEVLQRVPEALKDEEGPWKLLAWLDQIQPAFAVDGSIFPSYTLKLLAGYLLEQLSKEGGRDGDGRRMAGGRPPIAKARSDAGAPVVPALLDLAGQVMTAEEEHLTRSIGNLLDVTRDRLDSQLLEHLEAVDTFFEGLEVEEEETPRPPRQLVEELSGLLRLPLKLSSQEQQMLRDDPDEANRLVRNQVEDILRVQAITRLMGAVERRLEEGFDLSPSEIDARDWNALDELILDTIRNIFQKRRERLIGEDGGGQIERDLELTLAKIDYPTLEERLLALLIQMPQGSRAAFDRRTHRRVVLRTTRMTYVYFAARFLERREPDDIAADVLEHLQQAQAAMRRAWGGAEWNRLATARFNDLDEKNRQGLYGLFDESSSEAIKDKTLQTLQGEEREMVIQELGRQAITEVYRQLLLGVISELWVDYLTSMEALRISIGLEAYAQRDPLVEYKNRAFEMFQELLSNMRLGVISRMFTFRPRDISSVQTSVTTSRNVPESLPQPEPEKEVAASKPKRRRRRR
jgi:preprotein translocase subunit SecA